MAYLCDFSFKDLSFHLGLSPTNQKDRPQRVLYLQHKILMEFE